jgi:uncharacterized protein
MLMLISPAKTLDMSSMTRRVEATIPRFAEEREVLVETLKTYSTEQLAALMRVSENIATLNVGRYRDFPATFSDSNAKPALFAFCGDVYRPIHAEAYDDATLVFATAHLRILSGLYGLLRPLDYLYPYRLEMGTKLPTPSGSNLYHFWGERITDMIAADLVASGTQEILNLASEEYSKAVHPAKLHAKYITVEFKEKKGDAFRVVGIHAKHARGLMVDYVLRNHIAYAEEIQGFNREGYRFASAMSDTHRYVFTRVSSA